MAPREAAVQAKADNRPLVRTAPAIVAGERRMFRVLDVPLGGAGVTGFAFDIEDLEQTRAELLRFSRAQRHTLDRLSAGVAQFGADRTLVRSEEHTSELQSLMRISYAVFCLKKKNKNTT